MPTVQVRLGNIFDNQTDLAVIPCSAKGTISRAANEHVEKYGLPRPGRQILGGISVIPFSGSGNIAKYVAWAASVLDDRSSAEILSSIGSQLGKCTRDNPSIRLISAPLLGTGHGGLDNETAGEALAKGFHSTACTDAIMIIYAWNQNTVKEVNQAIQRNSVTPLSGLAIHSVPSPYKYHAFVSYRRADPDQGFARSLVSRLDAECFKVVADARDFAPQATFLEEGERCVQESQFTLAVISPRYLASGNTNEEAIICKVLGQADRKRRLIPLILESVTMPTWLYDIVGIDFQESDPFVDPFEKLKRALLA